MMFPKTLFFLAILTLMIFHQNNLAQTPPLETGVSQSLAKWRSANYSDVRYKLNITLEKGAPLMRGDIEIRVNLTEEGAKNDLILDWRTTQFAGDKDKPFARVVKFNEWSPSGNNDTLTNIRDEHLILPKSFLKKGENFIKIEFASPIKTSGAAITRYVDKEDNAEYIYSLFVPSDASTAFPVFDQPDLKARFQLNLTTPTSWKVVSNTPLADAKKTTYKKWLGNTVSGQTVFEGNYLSEFEETKPISTYVFAFAAGEFEVVKEYPIETNSIEFTQEEKRNIYKDWVANKVSNVYVRKSQAGKFKQHAEEVFRLNREGVKFLEDWFDYKFPFPKYDLVLIPEFPFGGMEHAGSTFLREDRIIFPTEPTKNDFITRANLIFHEAAHQWFGDTVTMKWFDDLWLKEGFAEFMAYKTLEKVMPEYNAWKIFYERNKQAAYLTDVTRGTTPIYQEIPNLSSAKSAYGNIVYRKAPSFLRQAEFYLGEDKFQTAVRAFLKKHEFANASWQDLVNEFAEVKLAEIKNSERYQNLSGRDKVALEDFTKWSVEKEWAEFWVEKRGTQIYRLSPRVLDGGGFSQLNSAATGAHTVLYDSFLREATLKGENYNWLQDVKVLKVFANGEREVETAFVGYRKYARLSDEESKPRKEYKFEFEETEESRKKYEEEEAKRKANKLLYIFPNYQDYGYGIFLLDEKSRAYVLENIGAEKDDFLRSMMWGSLWDSVRFYELAPEDYVKLVIKNLGVESDESTIQSLLGRVSTAMNYYIASAEQSVPPASAGGSTRQIKNSNTIKSNLEPSANADGTDKNALASELEKLLINKIQTASTVGQKITYFRALQSIGSGEQTKQIFKDLLNGKSKLKNIELKTKDKFDLVTRLIILGDKDALNLLADLEKTETDDAAKRYAYAARAGIPTAENKAKYWRDFTENKEISESWIESAFGVWNSPRHADLTLPYLEKALAELPNLKKNRKIFFVNGWLSSFIGGQKSESALNIVNKFLADNPDLDRDLRLKILENSDNLERAVKIRAKYGKE